MSRLLGLLLLLVLSGSPIWAFEYAQGRVTTPSGATIRVQIADTPEKRALGLGERDQLAEGTGMLFVFNQNERHSFWMKGMRFPLDILWIHNQRIVHVAQNVPPPASGERPVTVEPQAAANFVLEIPANTSASLGLRVGESVELEF